MGDFGWATVRCDDGDRDKLSLEQLETYYELQRQHEHHPRYWEQRGQMPTLAPRARLPGGHASPAGSDDNAARMGRDKRIEGQ